MNVLSIKLGLFPLQGLQAQPLSRKDAHLEIFLDKASICFAHNSVNCPGGRGHDEVYPYQYAGSLNSDYIRTARAKGLSENTVVYKHAFRNTMIPLITSLSGMLPGLFGGAMITETVFAIPGIGYMALRATQQGDIPFIMGYNMFLAILTVSGMLISDLMYMVVDPRVKLS